MQVLIQDWEMYDMPVGQVAIYFLRDDGKHILYYPHNMEKSDYEEGIEDGGIKEWKVVKVEAVELQGEDAMVTLSPATHPDF